MPAASSLQHHRRIILGCLDNCTTLCHFCCPALCPSQTADTTLTLHGEDGAHGLQCCGLDDGGAQTRRGCAVVRALKSSTVSADGVLCAVGRIGGSSTSKLQSCLVLQSEKQACGLSSDHTSMADRRHRCESAMLTSLNTRSSLSTALFHSAASVPCL